MKIISKYNTIAAPLLALTLLTACQRTELCYDHFPSLTLGLDWEHEWERDYGMNHAANWDSSLHGFEYDDLRPARPGWVNMVVCKPDGTTNEKYLQPEGGRINVDMGSGHSYLLYNGDTEYILFSDMASIDNASATATSRSRAGLSYINERHAGARSTSAPDVLYAAYVDDTPSFGVHDHLSLGVTMQPLVYTYVIRYEFDNGIDYVVLARGALAGMAESVYLRDGKTSDKSSIILYDCDITDYGCVAHVNSFGMPGFPDSYYGRSDDAESTERPYSLNLEVLLGNGKTVEFNYDIADQVMKQPRGGVITVKGISLDDQIGGIDSGFGVEISDWPDHDIIDLPIEVEP